MYTHARLITVLLIVSVNMIWASEHPYQLLSGGPETDKQIAHVVTKITPKESAQDRKRRLELLCLLPVKDLWTGKEWIFEWPNEKVKVPHSTPSSPRPAAPAKKSGSF